jgi:hypothetical protein
MGAERFLDEAEEQALGARSSNLPRRLTTARSRQALSRRLAMKDVMLAAFARSSFVTSSSTPSGTFRPITPARSTRTWASFCLALPKARARWLGKKPGEIVRGNRQPVFDRPRVPCLKGDEGGAIPHRTQPSFKVSVLTI